MIGNVAFYPWMLDIRSLTWTFVGGFLLVAMLYLWLRAGRDHPDESEMPDEPPIQDYAGLIQSSSNKIPTFLVLFIIGISILAVMYIVSVCIHGGLEY